MIKTDITVSVGFTDGEIKEKVSERLGIDKNEIKDMKIVRSHLDFSDKGNIHYKLSVGISTDEEREIGLLKMKKKVSPYHQLSFSAPKSRLEKRPVVVGAGPAGLFCALVLAEGGANPLILERGLPVDERGKKVNEFFITGKLDTECNIQFGEGGAGAYSDGKLKSGSYDKYKMKVLNEFVSCGGSEDITYSTSAHLGTDKLAGIIKALREKIISLGAEFVFSAKMTDFSQKQGKIASVEYEKNGKKHTVPTDKLILATGHSARDVYYMLRDKGISMTAKGFGIGVRIEHKREYINRLQYGNNYSSELPTASYHLVTHLQGGRSVYSFCMCPGGVVVPAASEAGGVVTNGMSEYKRDAENSNSALLVSVTPEDFGSDDVLAGIEMQRKIERAAYKAAGENYHAPTQRLGDFMNNKKTESFGSVLPSYRIGTESVELEEYLPKAVTGSLREAIPDFDKWLSGYYEPDTVLTGAETRSTSPLRVTRKESYEAISVCGLYPIGEGAGYAGGIVSSAADGVRCAEAILQNS